MSWCLGFFFFGNLEKMTQVVFSFASLNNSINYVRYCKNSLFPHF